MCVPNLVRTPACGAGWLPTVDSMSPVAVRHVVTGPGHGASPVPDGPYAIDDLAEDVIGLLDGLDVDRAHIVGLSLGGMTAMRLAARNPDRVDRMVLLGTGAQLPPAAAWIGPCRHGPIRRQRRRRGSRCGAVVQSRLRR